ncbi:MAG: hypothetical protein ABGZ17_14410, partial [Planctomycetaceae bacterium]
PGRHHRSPLTGIRPACARPAGNLDGFSYVSSPNEHPFFNNKRVAASNQTGNDTRPGTWQPRHQ